MTQVTRRPLGRCASTAAVSLRLCPAMTWLWSAGEVIEICGGAIGCTDARKPDRDSCPLLSTAETSTRTCLLSCAAGGVQPRRNAAEPDSVPAVLALSAML